MFSFDPLYFSNPQMLASPGRKKIFYVSNRYVLNYASDYVGALFLERATKWHKYIVPATNFWWLPRVYW